MKPEIAIRVAVLLTAAAISTAQDRDLLLLHTFDTGASGWIALGPGSLHVAHETSGPALALDYDLSKPRTAAVLPVPESFTRMQRIRFRARSDHDGAFGILLTEKPGADVHALFWASANQWQSIEVTPADFAPSESAGTHPSVDPSRIKGLAIFDMSYLFASIPSNPGLPIVIDRPSGPHTLLISNFEVLSSPPMPSAPTGSAVSIDRFDRGFLEWFTLGGMKLKLAASNPLSMPALEASYDETPESVVMLNRRLSHVDLTGAKRISLDVASIREAVLVISFELQKGGGPGPRFNQTIFPPAGKRPFHVDLNLDAFEHDSNSPSPIGGKLDPALLKTITIIDISGPSGGDASANTLWIGGLRVLKD